VSGTTRTLLYVALFLVVALFLYKFVWLKCREGFAVPVTVTAFLMPNCPHCVDFKPEWEKFQKTKPANVTAKTYSSDDKAAVAEFGVTGFPTIFIDKKKYEGPRTAAGLTAAVSA